SFGVLQSRVHETWALATSSRHGVGNDPVYNNTTCFETFSFPEPASEQREAIAVAAAELNRLREGWLNPPSASEAELNSRTLTNPAGADCDAGDAQLADRALRRRARQHRPRPLGGCRRRAGRWWHGRDRRAPAASR